MNPLTEARHALAAKLESLGYRAYATPVETPAPPCYEIGYGSPWITSRRLSGGVADLRLGVKITVPAVGGNIESLELLEQMVWAVGTVVPVTGETEPPSSSTVNQTEVLTVDLVVYAQVKE